MRQAMGLEVKGDNKFNLERRSCESYMTSKKGKSLAGKKGGLRMFYGYYQNGHQVNITVSEDGKGYQECAPVFFSKNNFCGKA